MTIDGPGAGRRPKAAPGLPGAEARSSGDAGDGVESNARLTASTAVVLFVLLAVEGVTLLRLGPLLSVHVFIGMVLVPPVLLKMGSTGYRFLRYYGGSPPYRRKGPPPLLLRLLGPFLVVATVVMLASGIALLLATPAWHTRLLLLHKGSFILWFAAMTVHVIAHFVDTARLAPRDWMRRTRGQVRGAGIRQWLIVSSLMTGILLGVLLVGRVGPWLTSARHPAP